MRGCDLDRSGPVWWYYPGRDQGPHGQHKTAHHGHKRAIAIGPQAQAILTPFLKEDRTAYIFSPRESREEWNAERRRNRKTPMTPSQRARRRKRKPVWNAGDRYQVGSYLNAIKRACLLAGTPVRVTADESNVALKVEGRTTPAVGSRRESDVVKGRLVRVDGDGFVIAENRGFREKEFTLANDAVVTLDGQPCQLTDLQTAIPAWHPHQLRHTRGTEVRRQYGAEAAQIFLGHAKMSATEIYAERDLALAERVAGQMG
jgi:integrase